MKTIMITLPDTALNACLSVPHEILNEDDAGRCEPSGQFSSDGPKGDKGSPGEPGELTELKQAIRIHPWLGTLLHAVKISATNLVELEHPAGDELSGIGLGLDDEIETMGRAMHPAFDCLSPAEQMEVIEIAQNA